MKLAISNGREQQEAEVYDQDGHTIVVLGVQTFEFEFPEVEDELAVYAFTEAGPLLLLEGELELLENYRGETIQLFNEAHDTKGRFASKGGIAVASAVITGAALIAHTYTHTKIINKTKEYEKEGLSTGDAKQKALRQKLFSTKIGGKKLSISYKQADKAGQTVAVVGYVATIVATQMWMNSKFDQFSEAKYKDYGQRQSNSYKSKPPAWPKEANDTDFKKMYHGLAKKYHPDVNKSPGATQEMQDITGFYQNKDWGSIKNLFSSAGMTLELSNEQAEALGLLISILFESIKDGSEFIAFPVPDNVEELPPFVVGEDEDGKKVMVLDKWTAALTVGSILGNWDELDNYLGDEDAGTDRPVPSKG